MEAIMIDMYDFGVIVIDGKEYNRDLIILPTKVIEGWWRREGHNLALEDLKELVDLDSPPEVLVVGTGYSGMMNVPEDVEDHLRRIGIEVIVEPTRNACRTFNTLLIKGRRVASALHLTC
ncbi:MAG: Mth938-like domain-containing protein [Candidatus Bathyarchaeia archaeon]